MVFGVSTQLFQRTCNSNAKFSVSVCRGSLHVGFPAVPKASQVRAYERCEARTGRHGVLSVKIVTEVVLVLASESGAYLRNGLDLLCTDKWWVPRCGKDGSAGREAYTLRMHSFQVERGTAMWESE